MKKKLTAVTLIGPYPPPIGGVSIHINRLSQALKESNINVNIIDESPIIKPQKLNVRRINPIAYIKTIAKSDVVHIHSSITALRLLHFITSSILLKKTIITIHSWRQKGIISTQIQRIIFSKSHKLICVSREIAENFKPKNSIILPAFLPPCLQKEPPLPEYILEWLHKKREERAIVFSSNASKITFHNGVDLYGIDMAIAMVNHLTREKKINTALIFIITTLDKNANTFHEYKEYIKSKSLQENILLIHEKNISFPLIISHSDITIRATNTDGDALSVRESLHFGVPVIASDVVVRPKNTITFKSRDQASLNNCALEAINLISVIKESPYVPEDAISKYIDIYTQPS